jgi:HEAT repeat protein
MAETTQSIGILVTDTAFVVRAWDAWLERATGIPAATALGQPLTLLAPEIEARGLLGRFRQVLADGMVAVLAPAFHGHLIACAPLTPSRHFENMQQHVTIAPLRDQDQIVGTLVTIEDVTARRERERDLSEALASPDERTRLRAAQALAGEPDAPAHLLIETLGDTNWRVRQAAVSGLAEHAGGDTIAQLVRALHDDHRNPSVLNSALQALAFRQADAIGPLIELLQSPDADLRGYVVLALGEQRDPQAPLALMRALGDPDQNVRYHAIEALGKLEASEATDDLIALARSGDFYLAFPALDALARIGDTRAAAPILPLLDDELLSAPAANALGRLGDIEAVAPLAAALNREAAPAVEIAQALAAIYDRLQPWYAAGSPVADIARRTITPAGARNLLDALPAIQGEQLPALTRVLGWLAGSAIDRALARLLAQPAVRAEIVEALVGHGPPVADLLIEQLSAEDAETRVAAAIALGRIGTPSAVPALIDLLEEEEDLATVAAGALAKIGDHRAFEPLLSLLGHPSAAVRQAAIGALNSLGHPELAARAGALLHAADPHVRESAVKIVGYFGYQDYADVLLERCHDPDERVRRAALEHAPFFEHPGVLAVLAAGLSDPAAAVRVAAARALSHLEDQQAVAYLIGALKDADAWVRYYAARSLGRHRAAGAVDLLQRLAQFDEAQHVRIAALEALGQVGGARALAALVPFAELSEPELASPAISSLGAVNHPDAQPALLKLLGSRDPARRLAAVEALGSQHGAAAVAPLQALAGEQSDDQLAQAAVATLAKMATPESIGGLTELLANPARRSAVVAALGQLGERQIDLIGRGLAHPHVQVRRAVVEALGRMQHSRATEYIGAALDDPEAAVRLAAATALGYLGSQGTHRLLAAVAESDPDADVRQRAQLALKR